MKHVFVVHSYPESSKFLRQQNLMGDAAHLTDFADSRHTYSNGAPDEKRLHKLQSADGQIQFYHFNDTAFNGLDKWINAIKASLPEGEKLDAIVLPNARSENFDRENLKWAQQLKEKMPTLKVLAVNPDLSELNAAHNASCLAWPIKPIGVRNQRISEPVFYQNSETSNGEKIGKRAERKTHGTAHYKLADGVDAMVYDLSGTTFPSALRTILGIEQKQAITR